MTSIKPTYLRFLGTVMLFSLALGLRLGAINNTVVEQPLHADATDYYTYALNLKYHQTYSRTRFSDNVPPPDALRAPGYPAFLLLFAEFPPRETTIRYIGLAQALLDSITVLLALGIFRQMMSEGWALGAGFLTAISPHLVSASTYVLTETLFTFMTMLALWLLVKMIRDNSRTIAFAAGLVIAAAALTRPTLQYFIVPLTAMLLVSRERDNTAKLVIPLLVGFVLAYSPWLLRNLDATGHTSDPSLTINALHHGMYPYFRYQDLPESSGTPYRFDPRSKEISSSKSSILKEIKRRFEDEPARHLQWYLLGKPATLFNWNMIAGIWDIYIYSVTASPYLSQPVYMLSHKFMKQLHWPLVILALFAAILAWIPGFGRKLSRSTLFTTRLLSLLILYFIALHIIAAPFPRYSIPLRPTIYGLAIFMCSQIFAWLVTVCSRQPADIQTQNR